MLLEPGTLLSWLYDLEINYARCKLNCPECHQRIFLDQERHHHSNHCLFYDLIEPDLNNNKRNAVARVRAGG